MPCLVVGGGTIAERKVKSLLESGADITLISPDITATLKHIIDSKKIIHLKRLFKSGDTNNYFLVIASTNQTDINKEIYLEANKNRILINCVDDPENCNFYVPAQIKRGNLRIAISTEGKLPLMARKIRQFLDSLFPITLGESLEDLSEVRNSIISEAGSDEEKKQRLFNTRLIPLIDSQIEEIGR